MKNTHWLAVICLLVSGYAFGQKKEKNIYDLFKSQTIEVDGYKINVEKKGKGEPVVFISGGPGSSHEYMQWYFGKYHEHQQVIFIDFLGRGLSDRAKDNSEYTVDNDIHVLEEVRKALKLEKFSIVAHSYGSLPAQGYSIKYPTRVKKLMIVGGLYGAEAWQANCDNYNHMLKLHFPERWAKVDSLRNEGYVSADSTFAATYGMFNTKFIYFHQMDKHFSTPRTKIPTYNMDVYYSMLGRDADFRVGGPIGDTDYRLQLKDIKAKTLLVMGRYDGVSMPKFSLKYKEHMPQARFEMFEKSGHNPYIEEPEKFYKLYEEFFEIKK